ncbi:MAG: purine-nucleoside phosphorylase [Myxococcales bacterium]|nr:purine-nucleoside phosphorylase [Myxococcales bacterium]
MFKRLLSLSSLACLATVLTACPNGDGNDDEGIGAGQAIYVGEWALVTQGPVADLDLLSIGDRETMDNYANRGNIDVVYMEGIDTVTVEMQRFTVAKSQAKADEAFARMLPWAYAISSPEKPSAENEVDKCFMPDLTTCYVRAYYDGQLQPSRDGVNFRVTLPAGWDGDLVLTTEDNLAEGTYPDRSDITVMGLAGNLEIDMDSGNAAVKLDPNVAHFAGCGNSQACEDAGFNPMEPVCTCSDPTNITIENGSSQASNMTVDVATADNWYTVRLENTGEAAASGELDCGAIVDCDAFSSCVVDSDFANLPYKEFAEINYPGEPAIESSGIRVNLTSSNCSVVEYTNAGADYDLENSMPDSELRGVTHVCVGCL